MRRSPLEAAACGTESQVTSAPWSCLHIRWYLSMLHTGCLPNLRMQALTLAQPGPDISRALYFI